MKIKGFFVSCFNFSSFLIIYWHLHCEIYCFFVRSTSSSSSILSLFPSFVTFRRYDFYYCCCCCCSFFFRFVSYSAQDKLISTTCPNITRIRNGNHAKHKWFKRRNEIRKREKERREKKQNWILANEIENRTSLITVCIELSITWPI